MAEKNSFVVYTDWYDFIKELDTDEERSKLFLALFEYQATKKEPTDFKGALKIVFMMMKATLDRDNAKYEEVCEKRAAGGFKGGAPKGNQNARKNNHKVDYESENNHKVDIVVSKQLKQAKQPDNETETETETENESESVIETETDNDNDVLTENERDALVGLSSVESVEKYISKVVDWQKSTGKRMKNPYKTIKGWIEKDGASTPDPKPKQDDTSYDLTEFEKYAMGMSFGNGFQNAGGGRK